MPKLPFNLMDPSEDSGWASLGLRDSDLAQDVIQQWAKMVRSEGEPVFSVTEGDLHSLRRTIVQALRASKQKTVEACGFAYYEVRRDDYTRPEVIAPILMDPRPVVLQFVDEESSNEEIASAMQRWRHALRAKTEYSGNGKKENE